MIPRPKGQKIVNYKQVFKIKLDANSQIKYYKVCLVAKEFFQIKDIDFNKIYSLFIGYSTAQTLLSLACTNSWHIYQMNAKSVFLNSDLKKKIYIKILLGQNRLKEHIWYFQKAFYSPKQTLQEQYTKIYKIMVRLEYKTSVADKCVFAHIDTKSHLIIVTIYVNDFLFISKFLNFIKFFQ